MDHITKDHIQYLENACKKYDEFRDEMENLKGVNLVDMIKKIVDDTINSKEDKYSENFDLILTKCTSLDKIKFIDLKNNLLDIRIYNEKKIFVIDVNFVFADKRKDGYYDYEMTTNIRNDELDMLKKLINNFDIITVKIDRTLYNKKELMK